MQLRPYQLEAVEAIYRHLREHDDNPCVVIPTAGGKTPVMATVCRDAVDRWQGRVLIVAHVKELLEQSVNHLNRLLDWGKVGVYSAGLKRRDTDHPVIVAGIQSIYKRACDLDAFDLVVIDEAHMIPPEGDGMYRTLLAGMKDINPRVRIIGLTATPFRMKSGTICAADNFLNSICYEIGVRELIVQGYLCPLVTKAGREKADTDSLHVRAGEFIASETEELMNRDDLVESACREIVERARDRISVLVFSSGVKHGEHIADVLRQNYGAPVGTVFGDTLDFERDSTLADFKAGKIKYLVNVNVLTTGFDAPNIDCVAMLRPTLSPGLYYQMVGRGFRLHPGKENCLVLDFGGNVLRHGPVDAIRIHDPSSNGNGKAPAKECPACQSLIALGYAVCPDCGHEFPRRERASHEAKVSNAGILSDEVTITEYSVQSAYYSIHTKRDASDDTPKTMRVEYQIGWQQYQSEWICFEHTGWARQKAESWWRQRSNAPVPLSAADAVAMASGGALCETMAITVRSVSGEKFDRIVGYDLGEKPSYREPGWDDEEEVSVGADRWEGVDDDSIPF